MEDLNKAFKEEFPGSHIPLDQERAKSFIRQREKELLKEEKECLKEISEILVGNDWCRHSVVEDKIDTRLKVIKELSNE